MLHGLDVFERNHRSVLLGVGNIEKIFDEVDADERGHSAFRYDESFFVLGQFHVWVDLGFHNFLH